MDFLLARLGCKESWSDRGGARSDFNTQLLTLPPALAYPSPVSYQLPNLSHDIPCHFRAHSDWHLWYEHIRKYRPTRTHIDPITANHLKNILFFFFTWNIISGARKVSFPITIMLPSGSRTLSWGNENDWSRRWGWILPHGNLRLPSRQCSWLSQCSIVPGQRK